MRTYKIEDLGFNEDSSQYRRENQLESFQTGRVILEHKDRYIVLTEAGELESEVIGNLRFTAQSRADLPAVGDWVAVNQYDEHKGLIHTIYPRKNTLERQAIGKFGEKQIIATNIDYGFIVQAVNRDFNINRLERYITLCHASDIEPVIVLTKVDLLDPVKITDLLDEVKARIKNTPVFTLSNITCEGLEKIKAFIKPGKTYCLLGSSGVGKSTLINSLAENPIMETGEISAAIDRGKHVTSHRELIVLESGGILIDNPGMREVGIADSASGLEMTFDQIYALAEDCKFNDCTHQNEKGCAILEALDSGELHQETYDNFMKLEREQAHFSATVYEKRKKDKAFGKMAKAIIGEKKKNKF
ncbi:MAG: ribosome small subunit-dependent GTPase A [Bacteroidota bacterium]